MQDYDIFVQHINYPTVPKRTERLRMTPTPMHSEAMIIDLVDSLQEVFAEINFKYQNIAA